MAFFETATYTFSKDVEVTLKSYALEDWYETIPSTEGPQILGVTIQKLIRLRDLAPSWRTLEAQKLMHPVNPICNGQAVWPLNMGLVGCPETSVTTSLRSVTSQKSEGLDPPPT